MSKKPPKKSASDGVGYRRPPKAHQFKPGQSGNPKGRPKGTPTLQEVMAKEATKLVKVKQGDEIVSVPILTALVRRVYAKALAGDLPAARLVFQLSEAPNTATDAPSSAEVALPSDDVIQRMLKRFEHLGASQGSGK